MKLNSFILLLVTLLFIPLVCASSVDLKLDTVNYGPSSELDGYIVLPKGEYTKDTVIELSTNDNTYTKKLSDVLVCGDYDKCTSISEMYTSSEEVFSPEIQTSGLLVGIKKKKGEEIDTSKVAKFNISSLSPFAKSVAANVGNDLDTEWKYFGKSVEGQWESTQIPNGVDDTFENKAEISSNFGSCQLFDVGETDKIQVYGYVSGNGIIMTPSVYDYSNNKSLVALANIKEAICEKSTSSFYWTECNLTFNRPINSKYLFCLTSSAGGYISYKESYSLGYRCTLSGGCILSGKNYFIKMKPQKYDNTLKTEEEYSVANTGFTEPFYQSLKTYYCPKNADCVIPINITFNQNENSKVILSKLEVSIIESDGLSKIIRNKFVTNLQSTQPKFVFSDDLNLPLSKFGITLPSKYGSYELKAYFSGENDEIKYTITKVPTVSITAPATAFTGQNLSLSANITLVDNVEIDSYLWNFSEGDESTEAIGVHTYSDEGTYKVTLTVKDKQQRKGIGSVLINVNNPENVTDELINQTLNLLNGLEKEINSNKTAGLKEAYYDLGLSDYVAESKSKIKIIQSRINSSLTDSQKAVIYQEVSKDLTDIRNNLVLGFSVSESKSLTYENNILPANFQTSLVNSGDFLSVLKENTNLKVESTARKIKLNYLNGNSDEFILITKDLSSSKKLQGSYYEIFPTDVTFEGMTLGVSEKEGNNLKLKEIALPEKVAYKVKGGLVSRLDMFYTLYIPSSISSVNSYIGGEDFVCGNSACEDGEDNILCPQDCVCGDGKCDITEMDSCSEDCSSGFSLKGTNLIVLVIAVVILLGAVGFAILYPQLTKPKSKPSTSVLNTTQLNTLLQYLRSSEKLRVPISKVRQNLLSKGWKPQQIDEAIQKYANSKKQNPSFSSRFK